MTAWEVPADAGRAQWTYTPGVGVGPLRFGMSHDEAAAVMDGFVGELALARRAIEQTWQAEFRLADRLRQDVAVTAWYAGSEGLFCVILDAQCGPQVNLDGIRLVGRVPSEWEADFLAYALSRGITPQYAPSGEPGADEFGLIMRTQRVGDAVLTRPALGVVRERANTLWDSLPYDRLSDG
ncbi:hypothetical protein [Catellatospora paridis]|uniref:hypothetical protein n=1 Tax=Catellatospora paridis TaxID=1617086 RepID=UPI0012D45023|nr:hypothetical protein [Catellatospora paridis]